MIPKGPGKALHRFGRTVKNILVADGAIFDIAVFRLLLSVVAVPFPPKQLMDDVSQHHVVINNRVVTWV